MGWNYVVEYNPARWNTHQTTFTAQTEVECRLTHAADKLTEEFLDLYYLTEKDDPFYISHSGRATLEEEWGLSCLIVREMRSLLESTCLLQAPHLWEIADPRILKYRKKMPRNLDVRPYIEKYHRVARVAPILGEYQQVVRSHKSLPPPTDGIASVLSGLMDCWGPSSEVHAFLLPKMKHEEIHEENRTQVLISNWINCLLDNISGMALRLGPVYCRPWTLLQHYLDAFSSALLAENLGLRSRTMFTVLWEKTNRSSYSISQPSKFSSVYPLMIQTILDKDSNILGGCVLLGTPKLVVGRNHTVSLVRDGCPGIGGIFGPCHFGRSCPFTIPFLATGRIGWLQLYTIVKEAIRVLLHETAEIGLRNDPLSYNADDYLTKQIQRYAKEISVLLDTKQQEIVKAVQI